MKEMKNPVIIFIGGLLMLLGVYFSHLNRLNYIFLALGALIFIYGLYEDLR